MNRIPQNFIDEILARTDIIEIIDNRITLRKMGSNYSALCPFHTEKSPSFTVSPTKQFYYCFGCGAHGNAIGFLMQYEKLEFIDAIETLATKAGLEIPQENLPQEKFQHQDTYTILNKVSRFYQTQLRQSSTAIQYLKSRGLSGEIAKRFALGFAPEGWENLNSLSKDSNAHTQLITAGMLIKNNQGRYYDRFRARIMFPIRDLRGRVIAFGGRSLGDEMPKYLNSPETPIFHKGQELYGLYEARQACNKLERVIIVEGYMDVIALAQHGIPYAVATLGTATSSKHLQRLFRYTSEIIFCFDGDNAGQQAAWRALEIVLPLMNDGIQILFILLPEDDDPDSFIRKNGPVAFEKNITNATPLSDFFFQHLSQKINLKTADGKARLAKQATELLNKLPPGIFQQLMFDKLAQLIGVAVNKLQTVTEKSPQITPEPKQKNPKSSFRQSPIALALSLLLQHPQLAKQLENIDWLHQINLRGIDVLIKLHEILKQNPELKTGALLEYWREHKQLPQLAKLAAKEIMLPPEKLASELLGALECIHEISNEQLIQGLLIKAKNNSLSETEKQQLQQLISNKQLT